MASMRNQISKAAAGGAGSRPAFRRPTGRAAYPHRTTLDLDNRLNEVLDDLVYAARASKATYLRTVIAYLDGHPDVAAEIGAAAHAAEHPDRAD